MNILNHKLVIASIVFVGVVFLVLSLLFATRIESNLEKSLANVSALNKSVEQGKAVLPDLDSGDPIANSEIRKKEVSKVKTKLPYTDPGQRFKIDFSERTQDVLVSVEGASIDVYRANKAAAEQVLAEFSDNACNLIVFWGPPTSLRSKLTKSDINTAGCTIVF